MSRWSARRWRAAFASVGGMAWITQRRALGVGWQVYGYTDEQQAEARRLYGELEASPNRVTAVMLVIGWAWPPVVRTA